MRTNQAGLGLWGEIARQRKPDGATRWRWPRVWIEAPTAKLVGGLYTGKFPNLSLGLFNHGCASGALWRKLAGVPHAEPDADCGCRRALTISACRVAPPIRPSEVLVSDAGLAVASPTIGELRAPENCCYSNRPSTTASISHHKATDYPSVHHVAHAIFPAGFWFRKWSAGYKSISSCLSSPVDNEDNQLTTCLCAAKPAEYNDRPFHRRLWMRSVPGYTLRHRRCPATRRPLRNKGRHRPRWYAKAAEKVALIIVHKKPNVAH